VVGQLLAGCVGAGRTECVEAWTTLTDASGTAGTFREPRRCCRHLRARAEWSRADGVARSGIGARARLSVGPDGRQKQQSDLVSAFRPMLLSSATACTSECQPNVRLYLPATAFDRFAVTRQLDNGLLNQRFAPSQRAFVLSGNLVAVNPAVPASIPGPADPSHSTSHTTASR
jgi:hypothetical protein